MAPFPFKLVIITDSTVGAQPNRDDEFVWLRLFQALPP